MVNKIIALSDEDFIKLAISLTPEEREYLKEKIAKSCVTCTNGLCRVEADEKLGVDENGNPEGYTCLGWNNDKMIGQMEKMLHSIK